MNPAAPPPTPANFPRDIDNLYVYEITRDALKGDRPKISAFRTEPVGQGNDCNLRVRAIISSDSVASVPNALPVPTNPTGPMPVDLPFKIMPGSNLYLFRLTNESDLTYPDSKAIFGPGASPIQTIPPQHGQGMNGILHRVGIYFVENNSLVHYAENNIPELFEHMPPKGWLGFICDFRTARQKWDELFPSTTNRFSFPIYLNLYDRVYEGPVWNADHFHAMPHQLDQNGLPMTHGGIHPGSIGNELNEGS